jgi:hypothetical protein
MNGAAASPHERRERASEALREAQRTAEAAPRPKPAFWTPEAGSGPARIVINLGEQRAYFYKGDTIIGESNLAQTKAQSGQAVTAQNFRTDDATNDSITASDVSLVKANAGNTLTAVSTR